MPIRKYGPPDGYYITDHENEIKTICSFLEKEGFKFHLRSEFEITYESKESIISIIYEKNDEVVFTNIKFKNSQYSNENYSVSWTAYYDKEIPFENYCVKKPYKRYEVVDKSMQLLKKYPQKFFNENYMHNFYPKYSTV